MPHFKGLAAVCGPSRTGTNPRTGRTFRRYPRAQLREYVVFGTRHRDIVGGRFCGCPRQALRYTDRPTRLWSPCWRVALSGLSVLSGQLFSWYSTALGDSVFPVGFWLVYALSDSEFLTNVSPGGFGQFPHFLSECGLRTLRSMCCLR